MKEIIFEMAYRAQQYAVFPHKVALVIGICLLLIGLGSTVVGILGRIVGSWGSEIGTGIWCGFVFFIAGISGIVASFLKKVPFIKVFMSCCLMALILSFVMVVLSGGGLNYRSRFYHLKNDFERIKDSTKYVHGILLLLGIGSFILSVIGTILGVKYAFLVGIRQRKCKKHKRHSQHRKNRYITDTLHQELTEEFLSPDTEDVCQSTNLPPSQRRLEADSYNSVPTQNHQEPRMTSRNKRRRKKHKRNVSSSHHHRGNHQTATKSVEHNHVSETVHHSDRCNRNISRTSAEHPVVYSIVQYFEHPSVQDDEELPPYEEFAGHVVNSNVESLNSQSANTINNYNNNNNLNRSHPGDNDETIVCDNFLEHEKLVMHGLPGAECGEDQPEHYRPVSHVMFDKQDSNNDNGDQLELHIFERSDSPPHTSVRLTEEENRKFLSEYWSSQMNHPQGISFYQKHSNSMVINDHQLEGKKHPKSVDSNKLVVNSKICKKSSKNHQKRPRHAVNAHFNTTIEDSENSPKSSVIGNVSTMHSSLKMHDSGSLLGSYSNVPCLCSKHITLREHESPSEEDILIQSSRLNKNRNVIPPKYLCRCNEHQVTNNPSSTYFCEVNSSSRDLDRKKLASPTKQTPSATVLPFNKDNQTSNDIAQCLSFTEISNFIGERNLHLHDSHVRLSLKESCKISQNKEEIEFSTWSHSNEPVVRSIPSPLFSQSVVDSYTITSPSSKCTNKIWECDNYSDDQETNEYLYIPGISNGNGSNISNATSSNHLSFRNCDFSMPCDVHCNSSTLSKTNTLEHTPSIPMASMMHTTNACLTDRTDESHPGTLSACSTSDVIATTVDGTYRQLVASPLSENLQRTLQSTCSNTMAVPHRDPASISQSNVLQLRPRMPAELINPAQQQNEQLMGHEQHRPLFSVLL